MISYGRLSSLLSIFKMLLCIFDWKNEGKVIILRIISGFLGIMKTFLRKFGIE